MLGLYEELWVCPVAKYHEFFHHAEDNFTKVEECNHCHEKVWYNKDHMERIDNKKYLKDHIREFAQPYGSTKKVFEELYGFSYLERDKKILKDQWENSKEYKKQKWDDEFNFMKRLDDRAIDRIAAQQMKYGTRGR